VDYRDVVEEHRCCSVEADPADEGKEAAEEDLDDVVTWDRGGDAIGVLALAWTQDPGDGESGQASDDLDGACSSLIGEGREVEEGGELG